MIDAATVARLFALSGPMSVTVTALLSSHVGGLSTRGTTVQTAPEERRLRWANR
jgi:hypothetical protein